MLNTFICFEKSTKNAKSDNLAWLARNQYMVFIQHYISMASKKDFGRTKHYKSLLTITIIMKEDLKS